MIKIKNHLENIETINRGYMRKVCELIYEMAESHITEEQYKIKRALLEKNYLKQIAQVEPPEEWEIEEWINNPHFPSF